MKPTSSNLNGSSTCVPISSQCVIWEGPDISCIGLCKGDTVTDVVYNLAQQVCAAQTAADLSDLDLTCLVNVCQATPEPEKNLASVLDLLINKVCCLSDIVSGLPTEQDPYTEPTLNLPACLQYTNQLGQTVTQLLHSDTTRLLAQKICELNNTVTGHTTQLQNLEDRVSDLENATSPAETTITPTCVLPATPATVATVVVELEKQFCQVKTILGTNTQLTTAISKQCPDLNGANALSSDGLMSGLSGWNSTVTNIAQMLQNMWLTICDMRNAVEAVQNCCKPDCSAIIIDFTVQLTDSGAGANLYFSPSVIPAGFMNCGSNSLLTVTDGIGGQFMTEIDLVGAANSTQPLAINFNGTLNPNLTYTFKLESCLTDGLITCEKVTFKTAQSAQLACGIPSNLNITII